jgi:hypothetical protein
MKKTGKIFIIYDFSNIRLNPLYDTNIGRIQTEKTRNYFLVLMSLFFLSIHIANADKVYLKGLYDEKDKSIFKYIYNQSVEVNELNKEPKDKLSYFIGLVNFNSIQESNYLKSKNGLDVISNSNTKLDFSSLQIAPEKITHTKFIPCECNRERNNFKEHYDPCLETIADIRQLNRVDREIITKFLFADYWISLNQWDSAKFYLKKILNESSEAKLPYPKARSHFQYAKTLSAQNDWAGALEQVTMGIKDYESLQLWPCVIFGYNEMAKLYVKLKKYHSAAQAASNVLEVMNEVNMPAEHCQALIEMAHAYHSLNLFDQSEYWLDSAEKLLTTISPDEFHLLARYHEVKKDVDLKKGDFASSKLSEDKYLEIQEEIKKSDFNYSVINARFNYQLQLLWKNYEDLENKYSYYYYLLSLVSFLFLIFLFLFIRQLSTVKNLNKKNKFLNSELEESIKSQILDFSPDAKSLFDKNKFNKLNSHLKYQLNDTDFKLLEIIYTNPHCTNKDMSLVVNISYEGVRSSLKKMYKIFGVAESVGNKKLSLISNVLTVTSELMANDKLKEIK